MMAASRRHRRLTVPALPDENVHHQIRDYYINRFEDTKIRTYVGGARKNAFFFGQTDVKDGCICVDER